MKSVKMIFMLILVLFNTFANDEELTNFKPKDLKQETVEEAKNEREISSTKNNSTPDQQKLLEELHKYKTKADEQAKFLEELSNEE